MSLSSVIFERTPVLQHLNMVCFNNRLPPSMGLPKPRIAVALCLSNHAFVLGENLFWFALGLVLLSFDLKVITTEI